MPAEARSRLAEQQTALLTALMHQGEPPTYFDADRVRACASALLDKRVRAAARAWPMLERSLGEQMFREHFYAYARATPLPEQGGPLADGHAFARHLLKNQGLADEARMELLGVELALRRGFALRCARLRQSRRFVIAVRIPFIGIRWVFMPLPK